MYCKIIKETIVELLETCVRNYKASLMVTNLLKISKESIQVHLHHIAARALDVHEVRVRGLYQALELVLPRLDGGIWVQQICFESL